MLRSKQLTAVEYRHEQQKQKHSPPPSSSSSDGKAPAMKHHASSSSSRKSSSASRVSAYVAALLDDARPRAAHLKAGRRLGKGMAAAFALGAEAVQMGTRFVSSAESPVHHNYKQAIIDAPATSAIRFVVKPGCPWVFRM